MGLFDRLFARKPAAPAASPGSEPSDNSDDSIRRILAAASVGYITSDFVHLMQGASGRAMTKEAWLTCCDPLAMLCFLHGRGNGRKFRLFATA
jgi:hypothetical protein